MKNEKIYQENAKHYHLTQQPDYENIKNEFRNIKGIQRYQFIWSVVHWEDSRQKMVLTWMENEEK